MKKMTRRSLLRGASGPSTMPSIGGGAAAAAAVDGTNRRAFLQSTAGAAGAAAVVLATPKVASVALEGSSQSAEAPKATVTDPTGLAPREPVTAYVHNAERNEVTVMSGTTQTTYKDPVLVKRLLDASR